MKANQLLAALVLVFAVGAVAAAMPEDAGRGGTGAQAAVGDRAGKTSKQNAQGATGYLAYEQPGLPESPGLTTVAGRVVGSLAVVIGLIFVTALGLRRWLGATKTPTTSRKVSELVEVTPLGGKRHLYLIRVADRLLVVGGGGDRLTLLSELKDPAVLEQVAALPRRSDFFRLFHRVQADAGTDAAAADQAVAG